MRNYWSWGGVFVGYRLDDGLFTREGKQMGFFAEGEEVYSCTGHYLGEVRGSDRLITNVKKMHWSRSQIVPAIHPQIPGRSDVVAKAMLTDYQDFPAPPVA